MSDTWNKIDVEYFPKNLSSENEALRSQLAFALHEKAEVERQNGELKAENYTLLEIVKANKLECCIPVKAEGVI